MDGREPARNRTGRLELLDIMSIVVGYGLSAVLFRAFWPREGVSPKLAVCALVFYLWLGLAMSGPLILSRSRGNPSREQTPGAEDRGPVREIDEKRTWAEVAWQLIGVYWIALGVFVLPIRLHRFRFADMVLFGAIPLMTGSALRLFGPGQTLKEGEPLPWTHHTAVALIITSPVAWICLMILGEGLL